MTVSKKHDVQLDQAIAIYLKNCTECVQLGGLLITLSGVVGSRLRNSCSGASPVDEDGQSSPTNVDAQMGRMWGESASPVRIPEVEEGAGWTGEVV
jgi:hypothetical protein